MTYFFSLIYKTTVSVKNAYLLKQGKIYDIRVLKVSIFKQKCMELTKCKPPNIILVTTAIHGQIDAIENRL